MKKIIIAAAAVASLLITGCSSSNGWGDNDQCAQAGNPQECAQVRDAGGNVSDYLMYGLAGYMLARVMTPSGPQYAIQPDPSYTGYRRPIASYTNSRAYVSRPGFRTYSSINRINVSSIPRTRITTSTVTTKSGMFGRKTTTTTTTTRSSYGGSSSYRPSYKPSYSSSSSSSYRSSYRPSYSSRSYSSRR